MASYENRLYRQRIPGLVNRLEGSNQGAINRHMGNLMGGQKTLLDDYVKRAAGAGIRRGGMNVVGGSPLESNLALQATRGLASQYGANYNQAVNAANADRASNQQLLGQLMSGVNASGGYDWEAPVQSGYGRSPVSGWQQRQAGTMQQGAGARRAARIQATQDRKWELEQRNWQRQDRAQRLRDEQAGRMRNLAMSKQAQIDQARQFTNPTMAGLGMAPVGPPLHGGRKANTPVQIQGQARGSGQGAPNTPRVPKTRADRELADLQATYQKQQMLNDLERQAEQIRQSKLATKTQKLQLYGEQYKQDAWIRAQNPYIQSVNAFLGLGGLGYGGMNNARLGQARTAADVWAGLTKPSNRSFSWSNSTSASPSRNSGKGQ